MPRSWSQPSRSPGRNGQGCHARDRALGSWIMTHPTFPALLLCAPHHSEERWNIESWWPHLPASNDFPGYSTAGRSQLGWAEIQKGLGKEGASSRSPASGIPSSLPAPWQVPRSALWIRRMCRVAPELCQGCGVQWVRGGGRVPSSGVLVNTE